MSSTTDTPTLASAPRWQRVDDEGYWSAYTEAAKCMDTTPAELTDEMIQALDLTDPIKARRARGLRAKALEAAVLKPASAPARKFTLEQREAAYQRFEKEGWQALLPDERAMLQDKVSYLVFLANLKSLEKFLLASNEKNKQRNLRLDELEARLVTVEERPTGLVYRGVWDAAITYRLGDVCTKNGSMWVSKLNENHAIPGESSAWQLSVKKGRDAR